MLGWHYTIWGKKHHNDKQLLFSYRIYEYIVCSCTNPSETIVQSDLSCFLMSHMPGWHICSSCEKAVQYMCYTCTYSLCKGCIKQGKFFGVRGNKGFCDTCYATILLIESKDEDATKVLYCQPLNCIPRSIFLKHRSICMQTLKHVHLYGTNTSSSHCLDKPPLDFSQLSSTVNV